IGGSPPNLHITVNLNSAAIVEPFLSDLRESVAEVKANPDAINSALIREQVQALVRDTNEGSLGDLAAMVGIDGTNLPEKMAMLNTILDIIPDEMTETVLIDFMNDLYV
ncbi:MAG TPA: hypothetical protein PK869_09935, partial [Candidatus Hydrogenedentes bacterium]|nr:hypothetical protein [Candidatus Hydrogenedentota bacterium]